MLCKAHPVSAEHLAAWRLVINTNSAHRPKMKERKEGSVLFNDALNTFYLRLYYGVGHMVKDHSDSEKGNPLPPHRLLFPISSKGSFIERKKEMFYLTTHSTHFIYGYIMASDIL